MGICLYVLGGGEHKGRGAMQALWWLPYPVSASEYGNSDRSLAVTGVKRGQGTLCSPPVLHHFQPVNTPAPGILSCLITTPRLVRLLNATGVPLAQDNFTGVISASFIAELPSHVH